MMEGFLPRGLGPRQDRRLLRRTRPRRSRERQPWWHPGFEPVPATSVADFDVCSATRSPGRSGGAASEGRPAALILPVGPMGMYRWAVYFLKEWGVACDHVHGFNMDEWSDRDGVTLPAEHPGAFQNAMQSAFYGPLGDADRPRVAALVRHARPPAPLRRADRRAEGEGGRAGRDLRHRPGLPHRLLGAAFRRGVRRASTTWKAQTHRLGARLHPLTIEQNALTSFKSRTTLVPAFANTIGPGLFLQADRIIGGADGVFDRGMQWQGASLWMTLRYGPDPWVPSSFMPTLPGRLFFHQGLAGPLEPDMN